MPQLEDEVRRNANLKPGDRVVGSPKSRLLSGDKGTFVGYHTNDDGILESRVLWDGDDKVRRSPAAFVNKG